MNRLLLAPLALALALSGAAPTLSQDRGPDLRKLLRQCGAGQCDNAVEGQVRRWRRPPVDAEDYTEALGLMALAIYEAARRRQTDRVERRAARALRRLSRAAIDPDQARAFTWVAELLEDGNAELYELDDPFSVSPS